MNLCPSFQAKLVVFILFIAGVASVVRPGAEVPSDYHLVFQTRDHFISVYCNGDLETTKAAKLAAQVQDAYDFVSEMEQWRSLEPLKAPLQVRVKTDMKKGLLGFSFKDVFTIGLSYIGNPLARGTLAHELTHCQDDRQLGKHKIPHYLMEGRALLVGRAYREKLGQKPDAYDRNINKKIIEFTAVDAQEVLSELSGEKEPEPGPMLSRMEFIGCFFMEFMRTHFHEGLADIQPRTARLVADVGQGMGYEESFKKDVGLSLEEAKKAFIAFINKTQGNPKARLKGTVWQDL